MKKKTKGNSSITALLCIPAFFLISFFLWKGDPEFQRKIRTIANYAFSFSVDQLLVPFEKPSLIFTGRQDAGVGYKDAWNFLEQYPRATFVVLDMAGHALQIEQETLFNALVHEFLDRVEDKKQ